jgi:cell division protein FtsQ
MIRFGASAGRGQPRRRVSAAWRRRWLVGGAVTLALGATTAGGWWLWQSGLVVHAVELARWKAIAAAAKAGFQVQEILVLGRKETAHQDLLAAVQTQRGAPIFAFDPEAARKRVEGLPWVKSAVVERMLPRTIVLRVEEREPLAIWQNQARFALIDYEGHVIRGAKLDRFANLLVVVGEDAPQHAAELLRVLGTQPELMRLVTAAVRVGARRWNVRLKGTIDVRLPEEDPAAAWKRLAEYEKTHRVLERDVQILDLRLPDRLIVRKAPFKPESAQPATDKET